MAFVSTIILPGEGESYGIASAPSGASDLLYVARGNVIYKVMLDGSVERFAGSKAGHKDGKALEALFSHPCGLHVAPNGDLYVCDMNNHRIRRIRDGVVTTVAGNGKRGFSSGGKACEAEFNRPVHLTQKEGYLFISDMGNKCIRVLDIDNEVVYALAHPEEKREVSMWMPKAQKRALTLKRASEYGLGTPSGICIDPSDGSILITDRWTHSIHQIFIERSAPYDPSNPPVVPPNRRNKESTSTTAVSDAVTSSSDAERAVGTWESTNDATALWGDSDTSSWYPDTSTSQENNENTETHSSGEAKEEKEGKEILKTAETQTCEKQEEQKEHEDAPSTSPVSSNVEEQSSAPIEAEKIEKVELTEKEKILAAAENGYVPWEIKKYSLVAGTKKPGHRDQLLAKNSEFRCPTDIAPAMKECGSGFYITDRNNNYIRHLQLKTGTSTFVGNTKGIFGRKDGAAQKASTALPTSLCVLPVSKFLAWVEQSGAVRVSSLIFENSFSLAALSLQSIPGLNDIRITNKHSFGTYEFSSQVLKSHPWLDVAEFREIYENASFASSKTLEMFASLINGDNAPYEDFSNPKLSECTLQTIEILNFLKKKSKSENTSFAIDYWNPLRLWLEDVFYASCKPLSRADLFALLEVNFESLISNISCLALLCRVLKSRVSKKFKPIGPSALETFLDLPIARTTPEEKRKFEIAQSFIESRWIATEAEPNPPIPFDYKPRFHMGWTPITQSIYKLINAKKSEPEWTFTIEGVDEVFQGNSWFMHTRWNYFSRLVRAGLGEVQTKRVEFPSDFSPALLRSALAICHCRTLDEHVRFTAREALFVLERGEEFEFKPMADGSNAIFKPIYVYAWAALEHELQLKTDDKSSFDEHLAKVDADHAKWEANFSWTKYSPLFPEIDFAEASSTSAESTQPNA